MSLAVARLLESSDVAKDVDPGDARSSLVRLTDAGRSTLADARRRNGASVAARLVEHDTHSVHDVATAVAVLRDLVDLAPTSERTTL